MNQHPRYRENTYCFEIETRIIASGVDEQGAWIALQDNIFHPQGGGQPADSGWINDIPVKIRKHADGLVAAYSLQPFEAGEGEKVKATICEPERLHNSALHTAVVICIHLTTYLHFTWQPFANYLTITN